MHVTYIFLKCTLLKNFTLFYLYAVSDPGFSVD